MNAATLSKASLHMMPSFASRQKRAVTRFSGLWAAELLGKHDADAEAYARDVVAADFEEAGDEDVFRKLRADFDAAGVKVEDETIREKMFAFLEEAVQQVQKD